MPWSNWAAKRDFDPRKLVQYLLVILIGPALLVIFRVLPFANNGSCDPWYLYGLYFNLPEQVRWYPNTRQVGRLAAALPGYISTHAFPSIASDYVLFLLFFTLAVFFLYKTAALLFSSERAALVAIFFGCSPVVVGNYAVTFMGPALTYEIIALYCAIRAMLSAGSRPLFGWMVLSGMALGASLVAHLAVLAFAVFSYLAFALFIALESERSARARAERLAIGVVATSCGAAALASALVIFSVAAFGAQNWSMIFNQVVYVPDALDSNATFYWQSDWYRQGPEIGMYLVGLGAAVVGIVAYRPFLRIIPGATGSERCRFAIALSFLGTAAVLVGDAVNHGIFLQYDYYFVLLWPFLALTIFAVGIDRKPVTLSFIIIFAAACLGGVAIKQYDLPTWLYQWRFSASLVFAAAAISLLLALQQTGRAVILGCCLLALATSNVFVRPEWMGIRLWDRPNGPEWRDSYARVNSGLKFLDRTFRDPAVTIDAPKFWVDAENVSDGPYYSRSYLSCGFHPFPNIDPERWRRSGRNFERDDVLVIVARPPNLFDRAKTVLNAYDLVPAELAEKTIVDEDGPYEILVVRLSAKP
jgi:hypothetical protein